MAGPVRLWSGMTARALPSRTSSLARIIRLLMLALGIISVPSVGPSALQGPHCAQHGASMIHAAHGLPSSGRAWTRASSPHECPHCPAAECAQVAPCAGSATTALTPTRALFADLRGHRAAVDLKVQRALSATSPPDTPPPQSIA